MKASFRPFIFLASLVFTTTLLGDDAKMLAGKWSGRKAGDQGQPFTQTIEIKQDKFVYQRLEDGDKLTAIAQGDFKLEKVGPFKTARFSHIRAGESAGSLEDMDEEYVSVYWLDEDTWTLASNFDKPREQKPSLDVYQRVKVRPVSDVRSPDEQPATRPPESVRFPTQDGGLIYGNLYGDGARGVVLAHGGRFNKESWEKQARELAKAGFRVLAIDFRGYGQSTGPGQSDVFTALLHLDVLGAVRYLRKTGAKTVSIVGGSMGGGAAADASVESASDEIDRLVMIGSAAGGKGAQKMKGRKLFITCRDDLGPGDIPRLPKIREDYAQAPEPKELVILDGSAHAQYIFATEQGERLMREILRFISAP